MFLCTAQHFFATRWSRHMSTSLLGRYYNIFDLEMELPGLVLQHADINGDCQAGRDYLRVLLQLEMENPFA